LGDCCLASSNPGPNAPLSNDCDKSEQPEANAVAAVKSWTKANFPAEKLLLGVPFYGYVSQSSKTTLTERDRAYEALSLKGEWERRGKEARKRREGLAGVRNEKRDLVVIQSDSTGINSTGWIFNLSDTSNIAMSQSKASPNITLPSNSTGNAASITASITASNSTSSSTNSSLAVSSSSSSLSSYLGGQIDFNQLVEAGVLSLPDFQGANGYQRKWDDCSSTVSSYESIVYYSPQKLNRKQLLLQPYLVNPSREIVVTYDDPQSIQLKATYAKKQGLAGVNSWDMSSDYNLVLTNAVRIGLRK
jgi:chitinase